MFKVLNSQVWRHLFIHMTEHEIVKVNVEEATVSVLQGVLNFERERLQPHSVKFSGEAGILIASFKALRKFPEPQFIILPSFILLLTDFLLYMSQVKPKRCENRTF